MFVEKKILRWIAALVALVLTSGGCATTPLQTGFPAEAIGQGKIEAALVMQGFAPAKSAPFVVGAAVRARYGLSERWDLVAATELETLTVLAKWSVWGNELFHVAPLFGVALAYGDVSWTVGAVVDVRLGPVTPYLVMRYQVARVDATRIASAPLSGAVPERFEFFSAALGARVRLSDLLTVGFETVVPFGTKKVRWDGGPFLATQLAFAVP